MDSKSMELAAPLQSLPPVEFCCAYGSSLLSNNHDKTSMVDYIFGVRDPLKWHSQNLEMNRHHYSKWMGALGPKSVTCVADRIGVGVHFNPFVQWREKMVKYGVVGIQDLAWDVLTWDKFYLSGRLQKPVHVLVDNWDIRKVNLVNLKSATSAALLLLPPEFTEEDLYAKICSLSYMGDLRMLFAEDINKDYDLSAATSLFSMLPWPIQRHMQSKLRSMETGSTIPQIHVPSREEAANCISKALRRKVMVSSGKQAVSAFLVVGGVNSVRYLAKKMSKAWRSRI